jgi:hypothetical protein
MKRSRLEMEEDREFLNKLGVFFYRIDPARSLKSISISGLNCGGASRLSDQKSAMIRQAEATLFPDMPIESARAAAGGWPIPKPELMWCPRLYFFTCEKDIQTKFFSDASVAQKLPYQEAIDQGACVGLRFGGSTLTQTYNVFRDGNFRLGNAGYAVIDDHKDGDMVVHSSQIYVLTIEGWRPVGEYTKESA